METIKAEAALAYFPQFVRDDVKKSRRKFTHMLVFVGPGHASNWRRSIGTASAIFRLRKEQGDAETQLLKIDWAE